MMLVANFLRERPAETISILYGMIVAQARLPHFYRDYRVPDTVNGRFDLLVLHLALFLRRLGSEPEAVRALGQGVFDAFCQDMEQNLREMGVGDLKVPREMRHIGAAYFGRARAYETALTAADSETLSAALARNVYGTDAPVAGARLAAYMRDAASVLAAQDAVTFTRGELHFPDPAAVAGPVIR